MNFTSIVQLLQIDYYYIVNAESSVYVNSLERGRNGVYVHCVLIFYALL